MKFADYLPEWKSKCRTNISESWCLTQDRLIDNHILPMLSAKLLHEVTASDISMVLLGSKLKGHSAKTTLHIYTILYSLFQNANEFFDLGIKSPVKKKFHRPKVPKKKAAYMTPLQTFAFLEYVMHTPYAAGIWCMALAALRVSETLPLKWKDIDFENDQINVFRIYNRGTQKIQDYTKNGSQIYAPLPRLLKEFLLKKVGKSDDFIMPNQSGKMMDYYNFRRYLRKVCEKLKLPIRSAHGLRHSCTEIWVNQGATAEHLRRLLNHISLDSTEKYIHRTDDGLKKIAKKIS